MINHLQSIILQKHLEVSALKKLIYHQPEHPIAKILIHEDHKACKKNFKKSLQCDDLAIIAEIKRKSPSKGQLATIDNAVALADNYIKGGANALSILTDELFFAGHLSDLQDVSLALQEKPHPILRKDFLIDEIQIAEAIVAGADAILCIVAVLGKKTKTLLTSAKNMGIEVLVEVHDLFEIDIALDSGAEIVGINNRDLATFHVDTDKALKLIEYLPKHIVKVAESGVSSPELARNYYQAGFDAVLIGEALVKTIDLASFMQACRHDAETIY